MVVAVGVELVGWLPKANPLEVAAGVVVANENPTVDPAVIPANLKAPLLDRLILLAAAGLSFSCTS